MSRFKIILAVSGMGLLITAFQNCGSRVNFGTPASSSDSAKASNTLVPVTDPGTNTADGVPSTTTSDTNTNSNTPTNTTDTSSSSTHSPHTCTHDPNSTSYTNTNKSDDDDHDQDLDKDNDLVACILDGPGESVKLGLLSADQLGGVNAVAHSVCVSANACLKLVSQSFKVKGVSDRGYCDHNPNVVNLTDAQVASLLGVSM